MPFSFSREVDSWGVSRFERVKRSLISFLLFHKYIHICIRRGKFMKIIFASH